MKTIGYRVLNLGQAETEPERYVPAGPVDCSSAADYRKAVDNAAARISYYQGAMQRAVQAGNDQAVGRASAGSDLANRDWAAWSKVLKNCGEATATAAASGETSGPAGTPAFAVFGAGALVAALAFYFWPKGLISNKK